MSRSIPVDEDFITINTRRCNGCGHCILVCGGNVFEMKRKKATVARMEDCLECGNCEVACRRDAIAFKIPTGGTGIVYKYG